MRIQTFKAPVEHIVIDDVYSEDELRLIFRELDFLTAPNKLLKPDDSGTAYDDANEPLKNNGGLFLDDVYCRREISDILTLNRRIFAPEIVEAYAGLHPSYRHLQNCGVDRTLVSYYEDGGYYKPHPDICVVTAVTWFFREPKQFDGGVLSFSDFDYPIELRNNRCVMFPSAIYHSVDTVRMNEPAGACSGNGRYAMSQFITMSLTT